MEIASTSSALPIRRKASSRNRLFIALSLGCCLGQMAAASSLSHEQALRIGRRVWQNECGGTLAGLTSWNSGEDFASLGIGHFIWYPAGRSGLFEESFPKLLVYLQGRGVSLPISLIPPNDAHCPWRSRADFLAAASSPEMTRLRKFLAQTIDLQADFLVERLHEALPKMLQAAPPDERAKVEEQFQRVASSAQGCYALVDYVNFKGEGTLATERYRGKGWGLLQVLERMSGTERGPAAAKAFADATGAILRERVAHSPPERHEVRWLPGWLNRVATYRQP
ncbi:MAG TPA: hypothetical protein VII74_02180 [Chthoniobacterales bacterium]